MPISIDDAYKAMLKMQIEENITDDELVGILYLMFQDDKISLEELEALLDKLGYEFTEEFKNMSPEDQKVKGYEFDDEEELGNSVFSYENPDLPKEKAIIMHRTNLKIYLGLDYEISEYYMYHILCMYLDTSPYLFVQDDIQKLFDGDIKKLSQDTLNIIKRDTRVFENMIDMVKLHDSERTYKSFSEYELQFLPPLPGIEDIEYEKGNYSWDGTKWCIFKEE